MIDLYYCGTPNGLKLKLGLEELGLPYRIIAVDIGKGDQFKPEYLAISPNNKIPALVDQDPADGGPPLAMFESGAMLWYLAERAAMLLPDEQRSRMEVMQWLFWQVGGLGPMAGQAGHFRAHAPEPVPYAIDRYTRETARLYGVLNKRLEHRPFIVDAFSIADIACYPWIVPHEGHGQDLNAFPHLKRWFESIAARPARFGPMPAQRMRMHARPNRCPTRSAVFCSEVSDRPASAPHHVVRTVEASRHR